MSRESDKKKKQKEEDEKRTGTTDPGDRRLAEWVARQWRREEQPTRLEAYRMEKVKGLFCREGVAAYSRTFKGTDKMDIDLAAKVSNEILGDCQAHCDAHPSTKPGPITYTVYVSDSGKSINARNELAERPIILFPQRLIHQPTEATAARAAANEEDEEDGGGSNAALRKTLKVMSDREEWRVGTDNAVVGEVLTMATSQWREIHKAYMELAQQHVALLHKTRELDIIDKDHEPARVAAMAKATLLKEGVGALGEGVKMIKYLLMGRGGGGQNNGKGTPGLQTSARRFSNLQAIVSEFISDCEKGQIDEVLFGKAEDGKLVTPGIFTQEQGRILILVRDGELPDSELEKLLPDSGAPVAITAKQYQQAEPVLTKAGLGDAIKIVFGFCIKARDARAEAAAQAQQTATNPQETATP